MGEDLPFFASFALKRARIPADSRRETMQPCSRFARLSPLGIRLLGFSVRREGFLADSRSLLAVAILGCFPVLGWSQATFPEIQSLIVFGDSLSDTGRLGEPETSPPGLVWVDHLAAHLGVPEATPYNAIGNPDGRNFAMLGTTSIPVPESPFFDASDLVADYLVDQAATPPANALFVFWLGTVDLIADRGTPEEAADAAFGLLQTLANAGARQFLLPELFPLGLMPTNAASAAIWNARAEAFNLRWQSHLRNLRALFPEARFITVRSYAFFLDVVDRPSAYGLENTTQESFAPGVERDYSKYLWYWGMNLTSAAHAHFAAFAFDEIADVVGGASSAAVRLSLAPDAVGTAWELSLVGPALALLTVERSSDLVSWEVVETFVGFDGAEALPVAAPLLEPVFYRAR
jgi:hypothetical protein